jgi:tripartite ATP-independent transporter DctM subunit
VFEWWLVLVVIFVALLILMGTGLPIAFCFMLVNIAGVVIFWGGEVGLKQLTLSMFDSLNTFTLLPLPLFLLMGEVAFYSGIATNMIDALDKWLGRLPGRLSVLAVAGSTLMATLTGASMASVAVLGSVLVPEMVKRGYSKAMTIGPIVGSAGLAIMIPPSGLAVLLGSLGDISIGRLLIAIIMPGILMAVFFFTFVIIRARLQPDQAPAYDVEAAPLKEKLQSTVRYILPLGFIIFMVMGVMILGIATPSEAAATGAISTFILAAAYRGLNWNMLKKSVGSAIRIVIMMFIIISASKAYGQVIATSGAGQGLVAFMTELPVTPILIFIGMQIVIMIMGCFMDVLSIMMVIIPLYMPIVHALNFNPVWFGTITLLNLEMATITPPFGITLFVMKGVSPKGTTMGEVYRYAAPYVVIDLIVIALLIAFPVISLWLPGATAG